MQDGAKQHPSTDRVLLIHGGLWEDVSADWFWRRTGVVDGLAKRGLSVIVPDRLRRARSWAAEAEHIASRPGVAGAPLTVVGGSFGCSVAVRLALDSPGLVGRLVLAWPAALGDQFTAIRVRAGLARAGAPPAVLDALLGTETLPSATDAELRSLTVPVAVIPSVPANPLHARPTVDALLSLLPSAVELPGCPEPPQPGFAAQLGSFVTSVADFAG